MSLKANTTTKIQTTTSPTTHSSTALSTSSISTTILQDNMVSTTTLSTKTTYKTETTAKPISSTVFVPVAGNWSVKINSSVNYEFSAGSNIEFICNSFSGANKVNIFYSWL